MTYLQFLGLFLMPPLIVLLLIVRRQLRLVPWPAIAALCLVALMYTMPWDNLLIRSDVWTYPSGRLLNVTFGAVPLEECTFFVLQTLLSSLLTMALIFGGKRLCHPASAG